MHANERILQAARSWLGVPYRKAGRDRRRGVDCLNYVGQCFLQAGISHSLPAWRNYEYGFWKAPGDVILAAIEDGLRLLGSEVEVEEYQSLGRADWRPGDLVCVSQMEGLNKATHAVIVESVTSHSVRILHARQGSGGCVESTRMPPSWRMIRLYRFLGWEAPAK